MQKTSACLLALFIAGVALAADNAPAPTAWYERATLKGDLRLREEYSNKEGDSARWRTRLRARARLEAQALDTLQLGLGLRTGGDDPAGAHVTLGDSFENKEIMLDLAYLAWSPEMMEGLCLKGGKFNKPWLSVSDMIWDGNVNPEGAAAIYKTRLDSVELFLNAGAFLVQERHNAKEYLNGDTIESSTQDTWLFTGQAGLKYHATSNLSFLAAATYYHYDHLAGMVTLYDSSKGYGNSTDSIEDSDLRFYRYEYRMAEALGEIAWLCPLIGMKIKLQGQYLRNTEPDDDRDGYLLGLRIGELKKPGSFCLGYNYRELQKNAALGVFAEASPWGGGADGRGHTIDAGYQITRNCNLRATGYITEFSISSEPKSYHRAQLELNVSF